MSASLIGRLSVKRFQALHLLRCRCRSRARASLRNRHQGRSIMGSEDEAEQSLPRPCQELVGRSKRTYELTSSIVPRGTSLHHWVELEFSPIAFDLALSSCCLCKLFSGPPEVGAVYPNAMHNHRQPSRQGNDRLLHPATPGDLHRPGFEPGPLRSDPSPSST